MDRSSITEEEFLKFASCIKLRCKILRVAHASLYLSVDKIWRYLDTGLVAIIKDYERRNYYLQFFTINKYKLLCEFEILSNCKYEKSLNNLYKFVGEKDLVNLTFDDMDEAANFESQVNEVINIRNGKMRSRKDNRPPFEKVKSEITSSPIRQTINRNIQSRRWSSDKNNNSTKSVILKNEISHPYNFQHLDHLGLDGYFFETPNDELYNHFMNLTKKTKCNSKLFNALKPKDIPTRIAPSIPTYPKKNPPPIPLRQTSNSSIVTDVPKRSTTPQGNKTLFPQSSLSTSPSTSMSPLSSEGKSSKGINSNTDLSDSFVINDITKPDQKKLETIEQSTFKYPQKKVNCHSYTEKGFILNVLATYFRAEYNIREAISDSNTDSEDVP